MAVAHVNRDAAQRQRVRPPHRRIVRIVHVAVDGVDRRQPAQRLEHRAAANVAGMQDPLRRRRRPSATPGRNSPCVSEITPTTYTSGFMSDRLFTPRFFVMCGFTFTVFLSAFQLLPTAPFRIQELGGIDLRLGPVPRLPHVRLGRVGAADRRHRDRIGRRRTLIIASSVILLCAIGYGADQRATR